METYHIGDTPMILMEPQVYGELYKAVYKEVLSQVIPEFEENFYDGPHFILKFYDIFEHSKKLVILESDTNPFL